jgi:SAM-dependent methyltransferase
MATVQEHYERQLGPVYSWMVGDAVTVLEQNLAELRQLGLQPGATGVALDLGAGPGLHAVPLAQLGFSVIAWDSCDFLLDELRQRSGTLPIQTIRGDLLTFRRGFDGAADVILCMGDTLPHLASLPEVEALLADIEAVLSDNGTFVATFRDYASRELNGADRFIPVRSDEERILTCFLEFAEHTVTVHDLLHERAGDEWRLSVSSYPKLRLDPRWVVARLESHGLVAQQETGRGGMVRVVACRTR